MKIDDGGPAFPCEGGEMSSLHAHPGMTLRQWFAGQAVVALLNRSGGWDAKTLAEDAFCIADAMIAHERKEREAKP